MMLQSSHLRPSLGGLMLSLLWTRQESVDQRSELQESQVRARTQIGRSSRAPSQISVERLDTMR
jgi:hypothetical protein